MVGYSKGNSFFPDPIARVTQVQELYPFLFKDSLPLATPPAMDCKWLLAFSDTSPFCGAAPQTNPVRRSKLRITPWE